MNPSRETKFSGTHGDRGIFVFPVQLTTSRIGNLTRLIHTLPDVMTIHISERLHIEGRLNEGPRLQQKSVKETKTKQNRFLPKPLLVYGSMLLLSALIVSSYSVIVVIMLGYDYWGLRMVINIITCLNARKWFCICSL